MPNNFFPQAFPSFHWKNNSWRLIVHLSKCMATFRVLNLILLIWLYRSAVVYNERDVSKPNGNQSRFNSHFSRPFGKLIQQPDWMLWATAPLFSSSSFDKSHVVLAFAVTQSFVAILVSIKWILHWLRLQCTFGVYSEKAPTAYVKCIHRRFFCFLQWEPIGNRCLYSGICLRYTSGYPPDVYLLQTLQNAET